MSETTPGETPVERRLREMVRILRGHSVSSVLALPPDDIDAGREALALLRRIVSGDIDESRIVKTAAALLARCEETPDE